MVTRDDSACKEQKVFLFFQTSFNTQFYFIEKYVCIHYTATYAFYNVAFVPLQFTQVLKKENSVWKTLMYIYFIA